MTETAAINKSSNTSPAYAATSNTGYSYASFLIGQIDKGSLTQNLVQEFNSRFRAISPYVQDNWKVNEKLTLDLGLRWDYFPTLLEAHDNMSFFNPNLANPITGTNGALQFAGTGANTCNCRTPVNNYFKNFGPRIGLAYQVDSKTVIRSSYGIMFTHGNAVGGGGSTQGWLVTLSASRPAQASRPTGNCCPPSRSPGRTAHSRPLHRLRVALRDRPSEPAITTTSGYTGTPSTVSYYDPYLGSRCSRVHQLDPWLPASVDQYPYFEHHLRRIAGSLPPCRCQQRSWLLGKPARSQVPVPGNSSELGWYIGLCIERPHLPIGIYHGPATQCSSSDHFPFRASPTSSPTSPTPTTTHSR